MDEIDTEEEPVNANDVVKKLQSRPPSKSSSLSMYWKALCLLEFGPQSAQPMTGKEKGQLSRLQSICGLDTRAVIEYVIGHWWTFATQAGAAAGTSFPNMPHIGFLVKHCVLARELYRDHLTSTPPSGVQSSAAIEDDVPAPVPPVPQEPAHILTTDELVQMLAGLKE